MNDIATERGVIFSDIMVRALIDGRKTQTRRLINSPLNRCKVGDRLWVREAWAIAGIYSDVAEVRYRASSTRGHTEFVEQVPVELLGAKARATWPKYRPSIHMPRWASRLTLVVEEVRRHRLACISGKDALAEGGVLVDGPLADYANPYVVTGASTIAPATRWFGDLWDSLHAPGQQWRDHPEVVALTFRVEPTPIRLLDRRD